MKLLVKKMKINNKTIHVVIPAYMEEDHIEHIIKELNMLNVGLKIWVVDDGSIDETRKRAKNLGVTVIKHNINLGQWAALKTGFTIAMMNGAEIIVSIDADGQHDPKDIQKLINPILTSKTDIVIGSRFLGKEKPEMAKYRYFGIKLFNKLLSIISGLNISDCTSGYRSYNSKAIQKILPHLKEPQYGALEFLINAQKQKCKIIEKPIKTKYNIISKKGKLKYGYNLMKTIIKGVI